MTTLNPEDKAENIRRLIEHLKVDPQNLEMWFEMERLYNDPGKRREILKGILLLDSDNVKAKESLERLDAPMRDESASEEKPGIEETVRAESVASSAAPETVVSRTTRGEEYYRSCPFCAERIRVEAVKCRYCGEYLDGREKPVRPAAAQQPAIRTAALVVLAACSLVILVVLVFFVFLYLSGGSLLPAN